MIAINNFIFNLFLYVVYYFWFFINQFYSLLYSKTLRSEYINIIDYLGTWYEVARLPNSFQSNMYRGQATYKKNNNNSFIDSFAITNENMNINDYSMYKYSDNTKTKINVIPNNKLLIPVNGIGYYFNSDNNLYDGRFIIKFTNSFIYAPYWIIYFNNGSDNNNIKISVVTDPLRKYCWILCSDKNITIEDDKMKIVKEVLKKYEFNLNKFICFKSKID